MIFRRFITPAGPFFLLGLLVTVSVAQFVRPPVVPHDHAGRYNCLIRHQVGAMEPVTDTPADHSGHESIHCRMCRSTAG